MVIFKYILIINSCIVNKKYGGYYEIKKCIIGVLCFGLLTFFLGPTVTNAANIYMGKYEGIFVHGDWNPLVRDSFEARLQPCGSITGSHVSGGYITVILKYFDKNNKLILAPARTFNFTTEGRLITQKMTTGKLTPPTSHDDKLPLGADVTFDASCKTCEGKLNVRTNYIED